MLPGLFSTNSYLNWPSYIRPKQVRLFNQANLTGMLQCCFHQQLARNIPDLDLRIQTNKFQCS